MRSKIIISILILLSGALSCRAAEIAAADAAYKAGKYAEAVELYKELVQREGTSAQLLYNLGNAYMKTDNPADAIVCYLRARRLAPGNELILGNLAYATSKIENRNRAELRGKQVSVSPDEPSFFGRIHQAVAENTSSDTWAWLAAGCFVAFCGMIAVYIFCRQVVLRKIGFFSSFVLLGATILFIVFSSAAASSVVRTDEAVIEAFKVTLKEEPRAESKATSAALNKGTVVQVLDSEVGPTGKATWYKVRLNSNYVGWLRSAELQII